MPSAVGSTKRRASWLQPEALQNVKPLATCLRGKAFLSLQNPQAAQPTGITRHLRPYQQQNPAGQPMA